MAKVFAPPAGIKAPNFADMFDENGRYSREKDDALTAAYLDELRAEAIVTHDIVGEVIRFQIADGYAQYMVWSVKPLELIHLPLGDAWSIPEAHARGLRLSDVRDMVEREKRIAALFASRSAS